jgi:hypothetical protein
MYRSHFTNNGRIVAGRDLGALDLDEAITEATKLLSENGPSEGWEGLEIWTGTTLVCQGDGGRLSQHGGRRELSTQTEPMRWPVSNQLAR